MFGIIDFYVACFLAGLLAGCLDNSLRRGRLKAAARIWRFDPKHQR